MNPEFLLKVCTKKNEIQKIGKNEIFFFLYSQLNNSLILIMIYLFKFVRDSFINVDDDEEVMTTDDDDDGDDGDDKSFDSGESFLRSR